MRGLLVLGALLLGLVSMGLGSPDRARAQSLPDAVVVTERFGAALRSEPSSDGVVTFVASCGEYLSVVDAFEGWYLVYSRAGYHWVGGARVADWTAVIPDCTGAHTFAPFDEVVVVVPSGCLSLRITPSRAAEYVYCVDPGYRYIVVNGPVGVDGEDWLEVWSEETGFGWVLAMYLEHMG